MYDLLIQNFNMVDQTYHNQPIDHALKRAREAFTQGVISEFFQKYPRANVVIDIDWVPKKSRLPPDYQHTKWSAWDRKDYDISWWASGTPAL